MSWAFQGSGKALRLGVSSAGLFICHGEAAHECRPLGVGSSFQDGSIDHHLLAHINQAGCAWTFAVEGEDEINFDSSGHGLKERFEAEPTKAHCMLRLWSDQPLLGVSVLMPRSMMTEVQKLIVLAFQVPTLEYAFTVEFVGFRSPKATTQTPTWEEFVSGVPFFSDGFSFGLGRNGK